MSSRAPVLFAVVAMALAAAPAVAVAQPKACDYTLSPPQLVHVSGTAMVTATLSPAGCDQSTPYSSVACLQRLGSDGPGRCEQNNGTLTAQVYLSPYQPGTTYVATGRGCATKGDPPQPVCVPVGPVTSTL